MSSNAMQSVPKPDTAKRYRGRSAGQSFELRLPEQCWKPGGVGKTYRLKEPAFAGQLAKIYYNALDGSVR